MMNLVALKKKYISYYQNSRGWKTDRKIVVIESDDWGSIRMPSKDVYEKLLLKGYAVDKLSYLKYDALESNSDLRQLFDVLTSVKDVKGNHPVITANTIMSNPDFDKIRASNFKKYYSEPFSETLARYPEHDQVLELYKTGIKKKIFVPQLHGMEHLNVTRWMIALQDENSPARDAFDMGLFDLSQSHTVITNESFVDALHPNNNNDVDYHRERLKLASDAFRNRFGFSSKTFIAPCYIWNDEHERILNEIGVELIQCGTFQRVPKVGEVSNFKKKLHYTGEKNKLGQTYTVRNCTFEPSVSQSKFKLENCINQIKYSFSKKKPAIISSHRVNFIGFLDPENRKMNLELFTELLDQILKKWPDVEFMTSDDLNILLNKVEH